MITNNKMKRYSLLIIPLLLILIIILVMAYSEREYWYGKYMSCDALHGQTITINRGVVHYSFEKPEGYDVQSVYGGYGSYITIVSPSFGNNSHALIHISVYEPTSKEPDALAAWEISSDYPENFEFEILDISDVLVDGIQAIQYTYSYLHIPDPTGEPDGIPYYYAHSDVYFDYDGFIWRISLHVIPSGLEAHLEHFEDFLNKFKMLN
ncbi:hypothetical protein ACFLYS_03465 [Chloroflexota bacterium]